MGSLIIRVGLYYSPTVHEAWDPKQPFNGLIAKLKIGPKGLFISWSTKWSQSYGLFFMVEFLKNAISKVFGPLAKCKLNGDQEELPCIKNG